MREVFLKFADQAFNADYFPNYNALDDLIMGKINAMVGVGNHALFTWLTRDQRIAAIADLHKMPLVTAAEIKNPSKTNKYKPAPLDYFEKRKKNMVKKVADKLKKPKQGNIIKNILPKFGNKIIPF